MLFLHPFITLLLSQRAVSAPAPVPSSQSLVADPELRSLAQGFSSYVKRLVGIAPRDQDYGNYGGYGKYGSYGSYQNIAGEVISETSGNTNVEPQAEPLETVTTTMPVLTTTVTLRSMATPAPTTITAVSTAGEQMSTRADRHGKENLKDPPPLRFNIWLLFHL